MDNNKKSNNVSLKNNNRNSNNNTNKNNKKSKNTNNSLNTFYIVTGILIILFLVYYYQDSIFYYYYNSRYYEVFTDELIINEDFEINVNFSEFMVGRETLYQEGEGNDISFYWEMEVPNLQGNESINSNINKYKPLIMFGSVPNIYFHPRKSILDFVVKYKDNPDYPKFSHTQVEIKQQKWNKILCVIKKRIILIYINGQLIKSNTLGNVPFISQSSQESLKIGDKNNNMIGKIRNLKIFFYAEKPENI